MMLTPNRFFIKTPKRKDKMKSVIKSLRLSQEQWEVIESKAKEQEQSFTSFALSAMLNHKPRRNKAKENQALVIELAKWGNNLNQVAKHLNTNKKGLDRVGLEMLARIESHLQAIRAKNDC